MGATERIAVFAAEGRYEAILDEAREHARALILDALAVMLAGTTTDGTRVIHGWVREQGGREEAVVVGGGFRAPRSLAAFANGAAGHALDYDDTILFTSDAAVYGTRLHPSVPTLAAALAAAEPAGASGRDLLAAFVYGFEVTCRVADAMNREHYRRGYPPTGVIGPLGAAVAVGRLLGLAQRVELALGEEVAVAGDDRSALRAFLQADTDGASLLRTLVDVPREHALVLGRRANGRRRHGPGL